MNKVLIRQILELRFPPFHVFFDHRSAILEALYKDKKTKKKHFEHWRLSNNRVDAYDKDRKRAFFFSFRNCGFRCEDPPTANYFGEQLQKYLGLSFEVLGEYIEGVQRIGFKSTRVIPVSDLGKVRDAFVRNFLKTESSFYGAVGATIEDVQLFPIVFKHGSNKFQVTTGPAKAEQLEDLWGSDTDLPEQALWLEVDYYAVQPKVQIELTAYIADFLAKAQKAETTVLTEIRRAVLGQE